MPKYGIRFSSLPIEKSDAAVPQTILARMNELKIQGCEVIIYILNQVGDDIYHAIKFFGNVKLGNKHFLFFKTQFRSIISIEIIRIRILFEKNFPCSYSNPNFF